MPGIVERLLVGGYTAEMDGRATGIVTWAGAADGALAPQATLPLPSPSYLLVHPDQPWVLAVTEGRPSVLSCVRVADDGSFTVVSEVGTGGEFGCHLALSPDGRHVVVAHYGSGSVASFVLGSDGELSPPQDLHPFSGSGTDPERQEGPHAHQVVFDGDVVLVPDLGTDRIHRLRLGPDGSLSEAGAPVRLPRGSGPRHLVVVGGDHLVVACELSATVWLGVRTTDGWRQAEIVPSSIAELGDRIAPSAIRADGDTVFVANRGAGTISVLTVDRSAHTLTRVQEFSCGGPGPRDLALHGSRLWVANQTTDVISVFDRDTFPVPRLAFEIASPSPACVVLLEPTAER